MPPTVSNTAVKSRAKSSQKDKKNSVNSAPPEPPPEHESIKAKHVRQELFLKALVEKRFNVTSACQEVGITRRAFYRWMEEDTDFVEKHKDVMEARLDKWEECLHKNVLAGSDRAVTYALDAHGRSRGYGKMAESMDKQVVQILADTLAGTITVVDAAFKINMLGYPLPEVIKIQLQKGDIGGGDDPTKEPISDEELDARYEQAIASAQEQEEHFLPKRQQEVLELKDELKAKESFAPPGASLDPGEDTF